MDLVSLSIFLFTGILTLSNVGMLTGLEPPVSYETWLSGYNDSSYHSELGIAWKSATEIKDNIGASIVTYVVEYYLYGKIDPEQAFLKVNNSFARMMRSTNNVYTALKTREYNDLMMLDKLGFDSQNCTGIPAQKFALLYDMAASFEEVDSKACSFSADISVVKCLNYEAKSPLLTDKVNFFNRAVSLKGRSALKIFEELHSEALWLKQTLHDQYDISLIANDRAMSELEVLVGEIESKKIYQIDEESQNCITITSENQISTALSGTFSQRISRIMDEKASIKYSTADAQKVLASKRENYFFDAYFLLLESFKRTNESIGSSKSIISDAEYINEEGRSQLSKLIEEYGLSNPLAAGAQVYYDKARISVTGEAIKYYSEGICLIKGEVSSEELNREIENALKIASQLEFFGYDVSAEKTELEILKSTPPEKIAQAKSEVSSISSRLVERLRPIIEEVLSSREKAREVLVYTELYYSGKYNNSLINDRLKFNYFENQNVYYEAHQMLFFYNDILAKYYDFFQDESSEYVSLNMEKTLITSSNIECNLKSKAVLSIKVKNEMPTPIINAESKFEFNGKEYSLKITKLDSKQSETFNYSVESVLLTCSEIVLSKESTDEGTYYESSRTVKPAASVTNALVDMGVPPGCSMISVIPSYSMRGNYYVFSGSDQEKISLMCLVSAEAPYSNTSFNYSLYSIVNSTAQNYSSLENSSNSINSTSVSESENYTTKAYDFEAALNESRMLLSVLKKAVTENANVTRTLNYSSYQDRFESLNENLNSLSDDTTFYLESLSKSESKSYYSKCVSLGAEINQTTLSMQMLARERLSEAAEYYKANPGAMRVYMQSAKDSFDEGKYLECIIYSDYIRKNSSPEQFPLGYAAVFLVVGGFAFYMFKKPGNVEKREVQRRIRSL